MSDGGIRTSYMPSCPICSPRNLVYPSFFNQLRCYLVMYHCSKAVPRLRLVGRMTATRMVVLGKGTLKIKGAKSSVAPEWGAFEYDWRAAGGCW